MATPFGSDYCYLLTGQCPSPPDVGPVVCDDLTANCCVTFASPCDGLDGVRATVTRAIGPPCQWRTGSGTGNVVPGCIYGIQSIDLYCGCDASAPCPPFVGFPDCALIGVSGTNNCSSTAPAVAGWRLVTVPDGTEPRLPVTWVHASPPIGIAHGYVVPQPDTDPACACPCPKNTRVDLLITTGAC